MTTNMCKYLQMSAPCLQPCVCVSERGLCQHHPPIVTLTKNIFMVKIRVLLLLLFGALGDITPSSHCDAHQKYLHVEDFGDYTTAVDDDIWCSW